MFLAAAMTAACVMGCASNAAAQAGYPEKPLQLIVPFPPGGAGDVVGRIIAGELETRLGKPVIVLNRPGGGTVIAAKEACQRGSRWPHPVLQFEFDLHPAECGEGERAV
jgi:tripartite-type tricarboxylate transporter receptor subunit TctC